MYKLIRFYNQNRKMIVKIILVIVFVLGIIQVLNFLAKNNRLNTTVTENNTSNIENAVISDKSAVGGKQISISKINSDTQIIEQFMEYCNNLNLENAYALISEECKDEMYTTIDDFEEMYYLPVFNKEKKNYTIENWVGNIYTVNINDDVLATGRYTDENAVKEYITVVKDDNGDYKLNINSFIGREYINKEISDKDINIKVMQENQYMDYSTYVLEVTNNSDKSILLDDVNNIDTMYIEDSKNLKYSAYAHELTQEQLKIESFAKKYIKIKYYSRYSSSKNITDIVFSKVILDYDVYLDTQESNFKDYYTFKIKL